MPNPLIILEKHDCSAARDFIIQNASHLKELGYKKILLEVSKEHSPTSIKSQLIETCTIATTKPNSFNAKIMLDAKPKLEMLLSLDKLKIPYECIDPQTESEVQTMMMAEAKKRMLGIFNSNDEKSKQLKADKRDKDISLTLIQQAKEYDGGVIYLGGFMHTELVKILKEESSEYRFAIFNYKPENFILDLQNRLLQTWIKLAEDTFRKQFYNVPVNYFDLSIIPSFELIEGACRLAKFEEPALGKLLSESTKLTYTYDIDEHSAVAASTEIDNKDVKKVVSQIKEIFPGLSFFTQQKTNTIKLTVPGINLEENCQELKLGLYKQGVMKYLEDDVLVEHESIDLKL
ncbi:MAG: hypothetical protein H0U73_02595 [Tatlockia sp.]|nr:hypothetical protein [Tatlockia sp.]